MIIQTIPLLHLVWAAIPAIAVLLVLRNWSAGAGHSLFALARMSGQLLLVGYLLVYIFDTDLPWIVLLVLSIMLVASSWIALRTIPGIRVVLYRHAVAAILIAGGSCVLLLTQAVLDLDPWYPPSFMVPLRGRIFSGSMTAVSLAAERVFAEVQRGVPYTNARRIALQAGLIPIVNALLAAGLVALPGLMTGQILSGVSPLVAVRYQVVIMFIIFGAAGLSASLFLVFSREVAEEVLAQ